jgi:hypothetical protein
MEIFEDSRRIVNSSPDLCTRISRSRLAIDKLYEIKSFGGHTFDPLLATTGDTTTSELIGLMESSLSDLEDIYFEFENIIIDMLGQLGEASKKRIVEVINANIENAGGELPYNIDKTVSSMLAQMESEGKINKVKSGNRYNYSCV